MIYLLVVIIFLLPIFARASKTYKIPQNYYKFQCLILILVAGLRYYVGGDTIGYMRDWDERVDDWFHLDSLNLLYMAMFYRPLCIALWVTCKTICQEFFFLQIVQATIVNISVFYIVPKYTRYKYEVAFFYLILQFLYFNCEIMRESLAVVAFYFAFRYYVEKKWIKYYLSLLVVFMIHDSVLIYFIFPFLRKFLDGKWNAKTFILIILSGIVVAVGIKYVLFLLPGERGAKFMEGYGKMQNATIFGTLKSFISIPIYFLVLKYCQKRNSPYAVEGFKIFIILATWGLFLPIIGTRMTNYVKLFSYMIYVDFIWTYRKLLLQRLLILLLLFNTYRYYFMDVSSWVRASSNETYYFYEIFLPYYSIFEKPDQDVLTKRIEIYDQEEARNNKK